MLLNILECQHRSENKQIAKTKNTIGRFRDEGRALEIDPAVSGLLLEDVAEWTPMLLFVPTSILLRRLNRSLSLPLATWMRNQQ